MNYVQRNDLQQVRALAWEFWANGWRGQLLGLAGVVGFASLLYGSISSVSNVSFRDTEAGPAMHFGFYWVTLFFLGAPILAAWGAPQRRYTLPTTSLVILVCPMVCSMVAMFVLHALAATMLNLFFDAGWPIWGPGLVAALLVAWLQAVLWSTSNSQGLQLVSCLVSFAAVMSGVMWFAAPGQKEMGWFHEGMETSHVLMFSLASLVCVVVGTTGFANLRHGGGINVQRFIDWASHRLIPKAARSTPFSSPAAAQFWLEWTERGCVLPVGTALIGVAVLLITPFVAIVDAVDFTEGISAILFMPMIVVGLYLGSRSENGNFGNFNGSRPLTDHQIAKAVLTSTTCGLFTSLLIWAAVMGAVVFILEQRIGSLPLQNIQERFGGLTHLFGFVILSIGAMWGALGLMTSLVLAGRKVGSVVGGLIVGTLGPLLLRSPKDRHNLEEWFLIAFIFLPVIGIVTTFVACWRRQLISRYTFALAVSIVVTMFAAAYLAGFITEQEHLLPVLWGCSLTPFVLAAAPLAVWWNRHR